MPQDRVSEFASMSPVRLLEETEKSIDPDLYETPTSLMGMARTLQDSSTVSVLNRASMMSMVLLTEDKELGE